MARGMELNVEKFSIQPPASDATIPHTTTIAPKSSLASGVSLARGNIGVDAQAYTEKRVFESSLEAFDQKCVARVGGADCAGCNHVFRFIVK